MADPAQTPPAYHRLTVRIPPEAAEDWGEFLVARGALGTELDGDLVRAWFPGAIPAAVLRSGFAPAPEILEVAEEPARDWEAECRAGFEPLPLGDRFVVIAPWSSDPGPGRIPLVIHPGGAFGTGRHASTELALTLLERRLAAGPIPDAMADVGAGSGILGIAAMRLGVRRVTAADSDPGVEDDLLRNYALNGYPAPERIVPGTAADLPGRFPLVVANIEAPVLRAIAPDLVAATAEGGAVILSGIRESEETAVLARYAELGARPVDRIAAAGWTAVTCTVPGHFFSRPPDRGPAAQGRRS